MQTKPLIHCASTKGIMIKLMLCVIAVLSLTMFIPQEVEACSDCTCAPGAEGRAWFSFDGDFTWACSSTADGDSCEINCGGHSYPDYLNPIETPYGNACYYEPDSWVDPFDFLCYHEITHRVTILRRCEYCQQVIGDTYEERIKWNDHIPVSHDEPFIRDASDPCKVLNHHTEECSLCHQQFIDRWDFMGWSHLNYGAGFNQAQPWRVNNVTLRDCCAGHEPDIAAITHINDNNVHALWCDCHGYVNRENCDDNVVTDLGEYAGDFFYGTPTNVHADMSNPNGLRQDGALHVYKHRYTYDGNIIKCDLCIHHRNVGDAILIARRTDNGNVVGLSDYDFSWDIGSWINSNVYFQHNRPPDEFNGNTRDIWQSWKLVIVVVAYDN